MEEFLDTIETLFVKILGFLSRLIESASQPLYNFLAVATPFLTPILTAQITRDNMVKYNGTSLVLANWYALAFESLGLIVLSAFVVSFIGWVKSRNPKVINILFFLGFLVILYMAIILTINVALEVYHGVDGITVFINILLCLMPILSSSVYGYNRLVNVDDNEVAITKSKKEEKEERIRLEKEAEKKRKWNLKHGYTEQPVIMQSYNADVQKEEIVDDSRKGDWRLLTDKQKREVVNILTIEEIIKKHNVGRSTAFGWKSKQL